MKNVKESTGGAIGGAISSLCYFLTMLFCVLRACDVITWKWYWIMAPIFVSEIAGILTLVVAGVIAICIVNKGE